MTRPMPGPPEHCYCRDGDQPCRSCLDDGGFYPGGVCPGCYLHNGDRGPRGTRLTDAECAAEHWRAALEATSAALNNCPECPGCQSMEAEELTWHRFATHPHALEEA